MEKEELTYIDYLKVTIPFILSSAVQPLLGAFNTALMGQMPETAYIAAVSFGVIFLNNVYWLFGFLRVATTTFASHALGRGSAEEAARALLRPLLLALILGVGFALAYPYLYDGYAAMMGIGGREEVLLREYLDIAILSAPLVLANYVMVGWFMGQMMIRQTMLVQISMNLLNIVLAGIFILYFQWDVQGLALAMVAAQAYGFCLSTFLMFFSGRIKLGHILSGNILSMKDYAPLLAMQRDLMLRTICLLTINNLFAREGNEMGIDYMAVNAILLELIFVISFVFDGMANGLSVFAGRSWGGKNKPMLKSSIAAALKCCLIFGLVCSVSILCLGDSLLSIMTDQPRLLELGHEYCIYLSIHSLTAGVGLLLYGVYTATGYTSYIRNMMLAAAGIFAASLHIFSSDVGNHGIWLAYVCTYLFESAMYAYGVKFVFQRFAAHVSKIK